MSDLFTPGEPLPQKKRYKMVNFLVSGGYADIWMGLDLAKRNRKVVVKVYKKEKFDSVGQMENYMRREMAFVDIQDDYEAYNMHLVDYVIDRENEQYILIMSYVNGPSFEDWLQEFLKKPEPEPNMYIYLVKYIFVPLAEFMSYIHHHGVLHRDLSAGNILIASRNEKPVPVLIDWGAALNFDPAKLYEVPPYLKECKSADEAQIYTSSYNPPEIDECIGLLPQSDIYSFGSIMYFAFTKGRYRDKPEEPQDYVASPRYINRKCPSSLDRIVVKCTQYEPRDRYLSFDELKQDLMKYLKRQLKLVRKKKPSKQSKSKMPKSPFPAHKPEEINEWEEVDEDQEVLNAFSEFVHFPKAIDQVSRKISKSKMAILEKKSEESKKVQNTPLPKNTKKPNKPLKKAPKKAIPAEKVAKKANPKKRTKQSKKTGKNKAAKAKRK
jgi:serine/threonine protein kinase